MAEPYEVRRAAATADAIDRAKRANKHALALINEFDGEQILVALEAVSMFLYHLYCSTLEQQGLSYEDFVHDVGIALGAQHARRLMMQEKAAATLRDGAPH